MILAHALMLIALALVAVWIVCKAIVWLGRNTPL